MTSGFSRASRKILTHWAPAILAAVLIYVKSTSAPSEGSLHFPRQDKLIHLGAYLVLSILWMRVWLDASREPVRGFWLVASLACAFGALIEIRQIHCDRTFEWGDILANAAGAALGAFLMLRRIQRGSALGLSENKVTF